MTLTEQWKKGELPEDAYYVTYYKNDTPEVDIYRRVYSLYDDSEVRFTIPQVDKVLAPVPSYEEWQKLQKNLKSITDSYKVVAGRCTQLEKFLEEFNALDVAKENKKLKEMLKECKYVIEWYKADYKDTDVLNEDVIIKIDNAIGEK